MNLKEEIERIKQNAKEMTENRRQRVQKEFARTIIELCENRKGILCDLILNEVRAHPLECYFYLDPNAIKRLLCRGYEDDLFYQEILEEMSPFHLLIGLIHIFKDDGVYPIYDYNPEEEEESLSFYCGDDPKDYVLFSRYAMNQVKKILPSFESVISIIEIVGYFERGSQE